ncbi:MAG: pyridoxal phosphate-dependent aminotransferase [Pirellulales bacterium]
MHRTPPDSRFSPSDRIAAVQSPMIPIVTDLVRANPGTISLGQGVVAYGPPPRAIERLADFLAQPDAHKYQACQGIPELLDLIERKLADENGVKIGDDRAVIVTAGGNMGFMNAVLAIVDPGDEVILVAPYYFNHEMAVMIAGARPVIVPTDDRYQPRLDALEAAITPRTRAIVTVSPNNPTGAVFSEEALRAVNALCLRRGLYHVSDEAYEYFTWDGAAHFAPASISGSQSHTIALYSLSKAYGFASWRIGYMVVPRRLFEPVRKIQDTNLICPPVVSQWAAVGALEAGAAYCRAKLPEIGRARRIVLDALAEAADVCRVPSAEGAFYVLIHVLADLDSMDVVERLVREYRVAAMPGGTFGVTDRCALRISYGALSRENAAEGIGRLVQGLRAIVKG